MKINEKESFFLDNPWKHISAPCYPEGRRLYLNDERFWVSIDVRNNLLFFVQDYGGNDIEIPGDFSSLDIKMEKMSNNESRLVCALVSSDDDLTDKFATVAKDIAYHCSNFNGSQLFLKTLERIKSWANFLKPSRSGLTQSEYVGFIGELYVLSEYVLKYLSANDAIRAWIGPEGKKQDFTFDQWALETKTTMSGDQQTIRISSLDQLDRVTEALYLLRVVLAPAPETAGICLKDLYDRCLTALKGDVVAEGLFLQKSSALYSQANQTQLNACVTIAGVSLYDVCEEFPTLTTSNVAPGIFKAQYDLSVGAISSFELRTNIEEMFKNGRIDSV